MNRRTIYALFGAALLSLPLAPPGVAQERDLAAEIDALKRGQQQLRQQVQALQRQLQSRGRSGPNVAGKVFQLGDNPVKGVNTAKLTLVEFTDYQ